MHNTMGLLPRRSIASAPTAPVISKKIWGRGKGRGTGQVKEETGPCRTRHLWLPLPDPILHFGPGSPTQSCSGLCCQNSWQGLEETLCRVQAMGKRGAIFPSPEETLVAAADPVECNSRHFATTTGASQLRIVLLASLNTFSDGYQMFSGCTTNYYEIGYKILKF